MATMVKWTHRTLTLYVHCAFCSILRSISVHMHIVFCVRRTVCDNVQLCADTSVHTGNCSAVWDALSVQYTCTEGSESVHVHHHVPNKRGLEKVFCGNFVQFFLAESLENIWLKIVVTKMSQRKMNEHLHVTPWVRELGWSALFGVFGNGRV